MVEHEFLMKSIEMGVESYSNIHKPWYYILDFETGVFKCDNKYGRRKYQLDTEALIKFENEIVGSHALEWTEEGIEGGLDGRTWAVTIYLADGTERELSGMYSYKYNYLRLERAFIYTEKALRGGSLIGIDYTKSISPKQWVDLNEARKKYPEEFRHRR